MEDNVKKKEDKAWMRSRCVVGFEDCVKNDNATSSRGE